MADLQVTLNTDGLERILREMPGEVEAFLDWKAEDMVTQIKLSFGESPSPVGGPPGIDTGTLLGSIDWEPTGQFERTISDGVEYGQYLEDGTERMGPRPFMRPVFDDAQRTIESDARQQLKLE